MLAVSLSLLTLDETAFVEQLERNVPPKPEGMVEIMSLPCMRETLGRKPMLNQPAGGLAS